MAGEESGLKCVVVAVVRAWLAQACPSAGSNAAGGACVGEGRHLRPAGELQHRSTAADLGWTAGPAESETIIGL